MGNTNDKENERSWTINWRNGDPNGSNGPLKKEWKEEKKIEAMVVFVKELCNEACNKGDSFLVFRFCDLETRKKRGREKILQLPTDWNKTGEAKDKKQSYKSRKKGKKPRLFSFFFFSLSPQVFFGSWSHRDMILLFSYSVFFYERCCCFIHACYTQTLYFQENHKISLITTIIFLFQS